MSTSPSILDELRSQYESARTSTHTHRDVEGYEKINERMHKAYTWLDKAFSYLDGVKPPIQHRYDVGNLTREIALLKLSTDESVTVRNKSDLGNFLV